MLYSEAIKYLESFVNYERISTYSYKSAFRLERMHNLLSLFDHPEKKFKSIHITGTKGKGSTSAMIFSILNEAGFSVGLYTSPHLVDFRERIRIGINRSWRNISEEEVVSLVEEIKPKIEKLKEKLSFFELYTTLAFSYFAENNLDFVVAEVGLGGRLDATNVLNPLVCGITSISFEHTDKLGNTLSAIAREKCGIIKENSLVVTSPQEKEVREVIAETCKKKNARLFEVGKNIFFEEIDFNHRREIFRIRGIFEEYSPLEMPLIGEHQLINAGVALGIIEALRYYQVYIPSEAIYEGFKKVFWPGRLEKINESPLIILDGAQNRASAHALKEAVKKYFKYKRLILVLGISKDKYIKGICEELAEIANEIILTKANNPRAEEPNFIKSEIRNPKSEIYLTKNVKEAISLAKDKAEEEDLILVTGSLFLVGEARKLFSAKVPKIHNIK
ncbi:MAG: bifunctional folylpolyglutamate synthase/dihydrofolate synthase [Candidatus Omnitrophica bacterium]|nr:bifunctional folylpolyglutamate synthase/dihydrofolate synthase [Candidatus Omnitrophota bacterium]